MSDVALRIQIWAPGLTALSLLQGLGHAQLSSLELPDPAGLQPDLPLLLLYADPVASIQAAEPSEPARGLLGLRAALPELLAAGQPCRLVNLSCLSLPALVAWCIDPASLPPNGSPPRFPAPDPFDALLAIEWLHAHPEQLQAYQALEAHPLAAALDQRPPDLECLERYRHAASLEALLQARQERAALRAHCSDLQLSFQAQQQDLEQLARRLALLEQLVGAGSDASLRLQIRLAQSLA